MEAALLDEPAVILWTRCHECWNFCLWL